MCKCNSIFEPFEEVEFEEKEKGEKKGLVALRAGEPLTEEEEDSFEIGH